MIFDGSVAVGVFATVFLFLRVVWPPHLDLLRGENVLEIGSR